MALFAMAYHMKRNNGDIHGKEGLALLARVASKMCGRFSGIELGSALSG